MASNLDRFKDDLKELIEQGESLQIVMKYECYPDEMGEVLGDEGIENLKKLPSFTASYEEWYSEAKAVIKQLLPDRLDDFVKKYEKPKPRKDIDYENYRIEDYLQGLRVTSGWEKKVVVDSSAAIPQFQQQLAILKAVSKRFESSLFDIRQLVQADLFDSEIDAADELVKVGFFRAAGALGGVVLEKHLAQVSSNHNIRFRKKNLTIADFNDALKNGGVIDTPTWRFIQHLGDIRNLCDHNKLPEPTKEQVIDLIAGVRKILKTLF